MNPEKMKMHPNFKIVAVGEGAGAKRAFDQPQGSSSIRRDGVLKICAWCRRIPLGTDQWVHVDEALVTLKLFSRKMVEEATHGVCPECFRDFLSGKPISNR